MGGNKKKLKKVLSAAPSVTLTQDSADDGLMDDLLAELEARDQKQANSQVVNENIEELTGINSKKGSKIRHKEREVNYDCNFVEYTLLSLIPDHRCAKQLYA